MLNDVGPIMTAIRNIFIIFDACIYYFVNFGFTMLFNIATFNIVDRKMIFDIVSRIQLIIGIFMLFQLAMTIIKGIVNPDSFTDSKNGGAGNVIMRIIVSLVLLALLVPLNISAPKNEYEKQINNNGVLFGTLYSLQYRILTNDTLGKLILGDDSTNYTSSDPDSKSLDEFGNNFTTTVIKAFYTLNVDDEGNYVCNDGWDKVYESNQITAHEIIVNGTRTCGDDNWPSWAKTLYDLTPYGAIDGAIHDEKYSISMSYITCTIVGIVLLVLLCMMIFNVAIRVFKLVALQLLAPIPVISYMDPKGSKDNAFSSWLKLLGTTYLELFIQLGVIYFAISIIKSFMERFPELSLQTVVDTTSTGAIQGPILLRWTFIIMTIALFIFAKDAPKFFKQMLGVKDDGKGFFGAFGTAMGFGVAAGGAVGSFVASRQASRDADFVNTKERARQRLMKNNKLTDEQRDKIADAYAQRYAHTAGNRAKNSLAGLLGAGAGLITGSAAASESKGNAWAKMMASVNAQNKRNANVRAAGLDGGTFLASIGSLATEIGTGQNAYDRLEQDLKAEEQKIKNEQTVLKTRQDALKTMQSNVTLIKKAKERADSKATSNTVTRAFIRDFTGVSGQTYTIKGINAEAYNSAYQSAKDQGLKNFEITDDVGTKITINMDDAVMVQRQVVEGNSANYYDRAVLYEHVYNREYQNNIAAGQTEEQAKINAKNAAKGAGGIEDTTILSARASYREANNNQDMAATYENKRNGDIGIKVLMGNISNDVDAESSRIARKSQELSARSQAVNDKRQSVPALRAKSNANRNRSGNSGSR